MLLKIQSKELRILQLGEKRRDRMTTPNMLITAQVAQRGNSAMHPQVPTRLSKVSVQELRPRALMAWIE
jgi:hypothetical protein